MERLDKPNKEITKAGTRAIVDDVMMGLVLEIKLMQFHHSECGSQVKAESNFEILMGEGMIGALAELEVPGEVWVVLLLKGL